MASSSSSPATRTLRENTMPESEMSATSVVPPPMSMIMLPAASCTGRPDADGRRHGFLDEMDLARPGVGGAFLDGAFLDLRDARGHRDDHARADHLAAVVDLRDEVPQHRLGDLEVGDDAVLERADGDDVGRGAPEHALGLVADGEDHVGASLDGDDAGLAQDDAVVLDVDEGVGGAEVDPDIVREHPHEEIKHDGQKMG